MPGGGARRLAGRVRRYLSPVVRPLAAGGGPDPAPDERALLLGSGLFDADWYAGQTGTAFPVPEDAVDHYLQVGRRAWLSPNPLFDARWVFPSTWRTMAAEPALEWVRSCPTAETHPLFSAAAYLTDHPQARRHPGGALGHFLSHAGPDEPLPCTRVIPEGVRWGTARSALVSANARLRAERGSDLLHAEGGTDLTVPETRWDRRARAAQVPGRVSILIVVHDRVSYTLRTVVAALQHSEGHDLEVVVVDNGLWSVGHQLLSVGLADHPQVRLVRQPVDTGNAGGTNEAFLASTGAVVVALEQGVEVQAGWLAPLLRELADPGVSIVAPLVLGPDGAVHSAGVVFGAATGAPLIFLAGFPVEDVEPLGTFATFAVTDEAIALTAERFLTLRGLDADIGAGLAVLDLCLRAGDGTARACRVVSDSRVVRLVGVPAKVQSGAEPAPEDATGFQDRWAGRLPVGPDPLWARAGFDVVDEGAGNPDRAVVVRRRTPGHLADQRGGRDRLRWALKVAAPAGPRGQLWGDLHFAESLARALGRLGQQVVVDRREAHQRSSGHLDDVVLNLRGLVDYQPRPGCVNLMWVISHPDLVTPAEVGRYDLVFAASRSWSRRMSTVSGHEVRELMQATDPELFHPGRSSPDSGTSVQFVGSPRGLYRPVVKDAVAAGADLAVHGPDWEQFLPDPSFVHPPVPYAEVGALYRSAGVVLNDHWGHMAREGFVSNRLFDAVACGARVVTDDVEGVQELFGGSAVAYRDIEDLRELTGSGRAQRFPPDAERLRIAAEVGRVHSFDARARELLSAALAVRAARSDLARERVV